VAALAAVRLFYTLLLLLLLVVLEHLVKAIMAALPLRAGSLTLVEAEVEQVLLVETPP
jgi:hypothetical protein